MARLVEFPLQDGGTVLVEVADAGIDGPVTRGLHPGATVERVADQAHRTFEEAVDRVQPAAESLIRRLRSLADAPEQVQVEFGVDLHAEAGAFIAAASTGANFKVTLTWKRERAWQGPPEPE
jgi:hypothetical protein